MKRHNYEGQLLTIKEIESLTNIKASKIRYRIKHGQPITGPIEEKYEYDGKTMTLKEWAVYLNVTHSTLNTRLKYNLPYEKVFYAGRLENPSRAKSGIYYDHVSGLSGTRAEMAKLFEVTPQTIHLWAKEGKLDRKISDKHVGETRSGWLITEATEAGLKCECEICEEEKQFKSIDHIRKCKNPEHNMIHAKQRLLGKEILSMKVIDIIKLSGQRNTRVKAHCNKCDQSFEIWESNMYNGCRCQR